MRSEKSTLYLILTFIPWRMIEYLSYIRPAASSFTSAPTYFLTEPLTTMTWYLSPFLETPRNLEPRWLRFCISSDLIFDSKSTWSSTGTATSCCINSCRRSSISWSCFGFGRKVNCCAIFSLMRDTLPSTGAVESCKAIVKFGWTVWWMALVAA